MNQEDLQIRLKVEEMIHYGYAALRQFPKSEKHVLSAEIRQCMYRILRLVIVCNRRYYKKTTMQDLDSELDLLRSLVRLSKDLGFLPFKQYEVWSRHNDQIGRWGDIELASIRQNLHSWVNHARHGSAVQALAAMLSKATFRRSADGYREPGTDAGRRNSSRSPRRVGAKKAA